MAYTVGLLLETSDGGLIFQHRDNIPTITDHGLVSTFGGHSEKNEIPIETAIRELQEETGLELSSDSFELFCIFRMESALHLDEHIYLVKNIDPASIVVYEGQGKVIVHHQDDFASLNLAPFARYLINLYWGFEMSDKKFNEEEFALHIYTDIIKEHLPDFVDSFIIDNDNINEKVDRAAILAFKLAKAFRKAKLEAFK